MLNTIKKHYLIISIILIALGLIIDLFFTDAVPLKTTQNVQDLTGHTVKFDVFTFSYKYEILKIISNICYGLAVSLIVLLALELKYDEIDKEKTRLLEEGERANFKKDIQDLQEQINTNVFNGVLKKLIPEELFNLISTDILNKNVLRQNAHWIYDVSEGTNNNYIITQTITYELVNISRSTITEFLTVSMAQTNRCKTFFKYLKIEKNGIIVSEKNEDQISQEISTDGPRKIKRYPIELTPSETAKATLTIVNEYVDKNVFGNHSTNYSIIGLSIEVNKPENCSFEIFPNFTTKLNPTIPSKKKIIYEKIQGILIGQGLCYSAEEEKEE